MKTRTITVDGSPAVGGNGEVAATVVCRRITVYENAQAGTQDILVRAPLVGDTPVTRPAGQKIVFEAPPGLHFLPGTKLAYLSVASGSITCAVEED